eukprot:CAMPEP_0184677950 /NCGR_PEP_ID=MMETSP0312-20130426/576_1 /TAXON_ID=31354 /ORGANISM="Compsopogon coeruleus, Strain SAG 36.94" /LENGTH=212 /DNA_ID=CAMNT_0027126203 /DNA_START=12 /DNA_END=650 /DNA_ORIENTATION=+
MAAFGLPVVGQLSQGYSGPQNPAIKPICRRALLGFCGTTIAVATLVTPGRESFAAALAESELQWEKVLTKDQFYVLRKGGTERRFSSPLNDEKRVGTFLCVACDNSLFDSSTKFDSGTGWPSFYDSVPGGVRLRASIKDKLLMQDECLCSRCGGHLGHRFPDGESSDESIIISSTLSSLTIILMLPISTAIGPPPTGYRYCINGVALKFVTA